MTQASLQTDGYKLFHKTAYAEGIETVYSNYTSRSGKLSNVVGNDEVVFVGLQYFIKEVLINEWNETFFSLPKNTAIKAMKRIIDSYLGQDYDATHFEELHDLGYLPIKIKALPEGVSVPYGIPPITFVNTVKGFQWLVNYIETVFSTENWPIQTSATTAKAYYKNISESFNRTGGDAGMLPFMCHDFSMRGCFGRQAAAMSGFGHLCSFAGTDTLPAILFAEKYYNADVDKELVGCSVPATEHSTATSYILSTCEEKGISKLQAEIEYVRYLFSKVPSGILSHVSDSFDFWDFIERGLPLLKQEILSRDGTFVVRPDSGDPVSILCGSGMEVLSTEEFACIGDAMVPVRCGDRVKYNEYYSHGRDWSVEERDITLVEKGLVEVLWDIFGGTKTSEGFKLLDSHIGAIYGDSITLDRQKKIISQLEAKGFVPNVVLGIGSYSYQHVTRDTHGSAVKATWVEKDGKGVNVMKDPATDTSKKSACGLLRVELEDGKYVLYDKQTKEQEEKGELSVVFENGVLTNETSLAKIRDSIKQ